MGAAERRPDRLRALLERVATRAAGNPGAVQARAVLDAYDRAGAGLIAGGLAYASLLALLPGLLLGLSVMGWLVRDPADQERAVGLIVLALPPFEEVARTAFRQVAAGAAPTGALAVVTLLWGASRFYANLDTVFSRIFSEAPRRGPVAQTVRGVALVVALMLIPVALVTALPVVAWAAAAVPGGNSLAAGWATLLGLVAPVGSSAAFIVAAGLCYRLVPAERVPWRSLAAPAVVVGLALSGLTQLYAFIAPRLVGAAALFGTVFAVLGLLAWLSIGFNALLLGAAWTKVRAQGVAVDRRGDAST